MTVPQSQKAKRCKWCGKPATKEQPHPWPTLHACKDHEKKLEECRPGAVILEIVP